MIHSSCYHSSEAELYIGFLGSWVDGGDLVYLRWILNPPSVSCFVVAHCQTDWQPKLFVGFLGGWG
jgi:hypothetical protein